MRLRVEEFRPRAGRYAFRVVQPRPALRHTTLSDPMRDWGYLVGDHDGLARLAGLFSFAAYSLHTVVHIPLRQSVPRDYAPGVPVDLVLAHQSLGLRPSVWPALRRGLTHGVPRTVRTDERRTARHGSAWEERWNRRWDRLPRADRLQPAVHARTLFLSGARDTFAAASLQLAWAAGIGPLSKRAGKGYDVLSASLTTLLPLSRGRGTELDIGFQAYPPLAHFTRPGRPARRRRPTAIWP
ncbi:hypothetical protein SALBM217S_09739 [Streptomyces griseoloalbus]|uniref:Uncharacterized protein n=1 Tax=Streptomyces pseudogriseolus TaxID=36817 RepID=A0ABQ2T3M5_STREZ|nr:hypothetical protein [Streptomyces rubiginosus]GGS51778.1 hypothetical protein GCM10010285_34060 [Streptomyces rubiginosus]